MATITAVPVEVPKPTPEGEAIYTRWLNHLNEEFARHSDPDRRSEMVRNELHTLVLGRPYALHSAALDTDLPMAVVAESFDPRNISLPTEMPSRTCDTLDRDQWAKVKPLVWFWQQFDKLPMGQNLWLAFRFHNMLGQHIFAKMGKDIYIYPGFQFLRGYTITMMDGTRIEPFAKVDDRDAITLSGCVKP